MGFDTPAALVVPDLAGPGEPSLNDALRRAIATGTDVILTTGGTGITVDDVTADVTADVSRTLGGRDVPGIPEALRAAGLEISVHARRDYVSEVLTIWAARLRGAS
jgi:molybdopterin biosynthesis enzyme MoaB